MSEVKGCWTKMARAGAIGFCALLAACSGGGGGDDSGCGGSVVSVTIEPGAATVVAGTPQPFVAHVTGDSNTSVTWGVQEVGGGTVSTTGVYTAPTTPGEYHVVATSQADSCASDTVSVTVVPASNIAVTINPPGPVSVEAKGSQTFVATVTGTSNKAVTWNVAQPSAGGSINSNGVYNAPPNTNLGTVDVVIATSVADPTKTAQATVNITNTEVLISPTATTAGLGSQVQFSLSSPSTGSWFVNGVNGGNATVGSISVSPPGLYTAPFQMPTPTTAIVTYEFAPNEATITVASRFLDPETLQIDACIPTCATDIPNAIVASDFNGDGLADLATANSGTGTVSLLISSDDSHFAAPFRLPVGNSFSSDPQALAVADLDKDSTVQEPRMDLVIGDADPSGLAVRTYLGAGDGTFGAERVTSLPSNSNPLSIAVGIMDSNAQFNVAVANYLTSTVNILRGLGDGTFQLLNTITTDVSLPLSVTSANFNNDPWDDLAVANSGDGTVSIFLSDGSGGFSSVQTVDLGIGSSPSAIAAVKLNDDNLPDLVVTTALDDGLTVILNTAGTFGTPSVPLPTGTFPVGIATGDFNKDTFQDVVVVNRGDQSGGSITTYFGRGDGTLVQSEEYPVGVMPQAVAVGDFNGDGWSDVAVANNGDDTVSVLRNRGGPTAP